MGNLEVRIRHGGGGGLDPRVILAIVAVVVVISGGGTVAAAASGLAAALVTTLAWVAGVFIAATAATGVLAIVFRARIRRFMLRQGDPRVLIDELERNKRVELARIRAMRLQIEAARIAGVEITDEILRMAEDPRLYDMVVRLRGASEVINRRNAIEPAAYGYSRSNPGHEGVNDDRSQGADR